MIAFLHTPPLITIDERLEECVHVKFILCLASTGVVSFFVSTTMTPLPLLLQYGKPLTTSQSVLPAIQVTGYNY
mgnify:FL=1